MTETKKKDDVLLKKSQNLRGKNIQDRLFYPETRAQQHEDLKTYFKDGKFTSFKMNANICRFLLSANFLFSPLNLWSFKTAGRQTASCLTFMKHLFHSPGWDRSSQPFTSPHLNAARLALVGPGPRMSGHDGRLCCIVLMVLPGALISGAAISAAHSEPLERR